MSMRRVAKLGLAVAIVTMWVTASLAADCGANSGALGTSRVMAVSPSEFPLVGKLEYRESLRLNDREVVLTFDDGPAAPYTSNILDILASECIKATFFMSGSAIADAPDIARRAFNEGHTIGSHTYDGGDLDELPVELAKADIDKGLAAAAEALGNPGNVAPFFRAPGLVISKPAERYVLSKGLMIWSADVDVDDWNEPSEDEFVARAMAGLEREGKGILLMRDAQPVTARALRQLIAQLKAKKFRIVHVIPSKAPATTGSTR
ncbi:MAG TPA: polysaccharide deacetylase family protein [Pseudorhodoplanes sp.]|nr:polysaccharide deacetylase family protein [Pseudorhodoplanes sp.]